MNKQELLHEIEVCESALQASLNRNGGHYGSTESYGLKMRLEAFTDLLSKYFA